MIKPLVTVIVPCYNYQDKVARAIRSIQVQTLTNLECFVVDNNSTDNSKQVILDTIQGDSRFHYVNCEAQGVAHARNLGVEMGTGIFYCCLDADDEIMPEFLETCVNVLEADPSLGIAFTGLWYIKSDGSEGLSPWPGEYDFNKQLVKQNQVPTCHVGRRDMWIRLGGQNQRYAPMGAGAEDGEFILRCGAYGYGAKKATDAGMFRYSWMSGRVSGNKDYREVDWLAFHPFAKDGQHPFASLATPANKRMSHPVRQYDEPDVSVIIPVSAEHIRLLPDALDSLESQTYRRWEVVAVLDGEVNYKDFKPISTVYPYVRWVDLPEKGKGPGWARNQGVKAARAPLLLFLDADDWLYPETIDKLLSTYRKMGNISYSDYVGKAFMDKESAQKMGDRLLHYDDKKGEAVMAYKAADYDCDLALSQPNNPRIYIWNLVTSIVPKAWHNQIGGFDEKMPSWEDWDYWLRMARAGKCFTRIPEPLVVYRFYTGTRRDRGVELNQSLLQYLSDKYRGAQNMPCNCGSKARVYTPPEVVPQSQAQGASTMIKNMNDEDMVLVEYTSLNRGSHKVVGAVTKKFLGYRSGGDRFLIPRADLALMGNMFRSVQSMIEIPTETREPLPEPQPVAFEIIQPPEEIQKIETENIPSGDIIGFLNEVADNTAVSSFRLGDLPGVTPQIEKELTEAGVTSASDILEMGVEGLLKIKGIGEARAKAIIDGVAEYLK